MKFHGENWIARLTEKSNLDNEKSSLSHIFKLWKDNSSPLALKSDTTLLTTISLTPQDNTSLKIETFWKHQSYKQEAKSACASDTCMDICLPAYPQIQAIVNNNVFYHLKVASKSWIFSLIEPVITPEYIYLLISVS